LILVAQNNGKLKAFKRKSPWRVIFYNYWKTLYKQIDPKKAYFYKVDLMTKKLYLF
jgi:hypothetical protein